MALHFIWWAWVAVWKLVLAAYHEEKIGKFIDGWISSIQDSEMPDVRKKFWSDRLEGFKQAMPKKQLIDDTLEYSKEEVDMFIKNLTDAISEFTLELWKKWQAFGNELADEFMNLFWWKEKLNKLKKEVWDLLESLLWEGK